MMLFLRRFSHPLAGTFMALLSLSATAGVDIQHWTARTGARVFFVQTSSLPILDVQIDFAAGGLYAPRDLSGLAGLTHGLLDTGAGVLDEEQIAARLVDTGAQLSGSVDLDRASLRLRTLTSARERDDSLELLRTVLSEPSFPGPVLEREKSRSVSAIRDAETRPDAIGSRRFAAAMYPDHPYGVQPSVETVEKITRDDLVRFYRARYQAANATVAIIGDVTRAQAEAMAERLTAALPKPVSEVKDALPGVKLPKTETISLEHPASQSHIFVGLPAVERGHPDYIPLLVGNYTLGGGGFVSRLMKEVREKRGYAYSVGSSFSPRKQAGPFQIGLQTKRDQAKVALTVLNEVLNTFLAEGPSATELSAAKKNLIDGMALGIDSNAKLLGYLSVIGFYGLPLTYLDDFPNRVEAVTREQVKAAFNKHVKPEHLITVIVAGD